MSEDRSRNTMILKSQRDELIKQKIFYDGINRPIIIYTAPTDAVDGSPATRVDYTYTDADNSFVDTMKESLVAWDSAWD